MTGTRPRRVLVIYNPVAGRRRRARFEAVLRALDAEGCAVVVEETRGPGDAGRIAQGARPDSFDVIAVAGGDGTINEALGGLGADAPPIAVVPLGTANVAAIEIGLDRSPAVIAAAIARGEPATVHLGRINGRAFLLMAGAGFDAAVVAAVTPSLKRRLGRHAYVLEAIRCLARHDYAPLAVTIDGRTYHAASVVVGNGRHYGGRFSCTPDARIEEPGFEVCLAHRGGPIATLRYALALGLGILTRLSDVTLVRGAAIRIDGPRGAPVQADGDIVATLPARIDVAPGTVRILRPPHMRVLA